MVNRLDVSTKRILQQNRRLAEDLRLHVQETAELQKLKARCAPGRAGDWEARARRAMRGGARGPAMRVRRAQAHAHARAHTLKGVELGKLEARCAPGRSGP